MNIFQRLTRLLVRSGREEQQLEQAIGLAKGKQPEQAVEIYNRLLATPTIRADFRCRALFNRALAYSSLKDDVQALKDLQEVLNSPGVPENVQTAARSQLARVRNRSDRNRATS